MKYYAIIVGGGSGKRMQTSVAKQFLLLKNKPVVMHTLAAFDSCLFRPEIILVLHPDLHSQWQSLCLQYNFTIPHQLIVGGEERFHSVRNGLLAIKGEGIVAIHDAVRPLVSSKLIAKSYEVANEKGNAITCIKPSDSVREIKSPTESSGVDRDKLVLIQTPQTFQMSQLRLGYQQHFKKEFTDDASVIEHAGFKIHLLEGERKNFKITFTEDLELAELLLN